MPRSFASQFTPRKVIIMQINPSMFSAEETSLRQDLTLEACRYIVNTLHVISDHVSLGSQDQYLPHASLAHAAPENMAKVRSGKPKTTSLFAVDLSLSMPGSEKPNDEAKPFFLRGATIRQLASMAELTTNTA